MGLRVTRRPGESIICDGGLRIVFIGLDRRGRACIDIQGPRTNRVLREEIATGHDRHKMGHDSVPPEGIPRRRRDGSIIEEGETA